MKNRETIISIIKKYANEDLEYNEHTNLLEEGILTSFGFMNVLVEIEEKSGKNLKMENIDIEQICSIQGMESLFK